MRSSQSYPCTDKNIKEKLLLWANKFDKTCFLNNNNYPATIPGSAYTNHSECLVAVGSETELIASISSFDELKTFYEEQKDWLFGFLTYDLKNETEKLQSTNFDGLGFPKMHFFVPKFVIEVTQSELRILFTTNSSTTQADNAFQDIINTQLPEQNNHTKTHIRQRVSRDEYIETIEGLRTHIAKGDIYETNFCIEFYDDEADINPAQTYIALNKISPTPFSCFYKLDNKYLISASPERFLHKTGNKIISQPIKGTTKRSANEAEDTLLKQALKANTKERSENIMIVDLVRNDLSITAEKGSVRVDELCEIYSFKQVHQMISTISSTLRPEIHFIDAIKSLFPMGSMTGAPKVRAMQLIEKYEKTKRGLYSGAVGYIKPNGDFDFNVVIRSILYNAEKHYLSYMVGSAITFNSVAEQEYEECLLKAQAMRQCLSFNCL